MKLQNIVPWGRSLAEYRAMFSLTDHDLTRNILGCGDGPAGFNAELTASGGKVVSVDPIYRFTSDQIRLRIDEVYDEVMSQLAVNTDRYIWKDIKSVEHLGEIRMAAMQTFLSDYEAGLKQGRYVDASLPILPFDDNRFDLALCSHFLFLYSAHIDLQQHIQGMKELCRVAREVRVYPLLALDDKPSPHVKPVSESLSEMGMSVSIIPVTYRFQKGATEMLVVKP